MTIITIHKTYTIIDKNGIPHIFNNGIEYTKYLRKIEKSKYPIIFTSFLSLGQVLRHVSNSQIVQAIGHGFVPLPYSDEELKEVSDNVKPLTDLQLTDIIINYCQVRSAVRESFHILKGKLSQLQNSKEDKAIVANKVIALFESYKQDLKRDVPDFPEVITAFENIIQKFDANDLSTLDAIRNQQEEALTAYLPAEDDKEEERSRISKNWEVLFLDDRPDELSPIFDLLEKRGIEYHITTTAAEAEAKISADLLNKITVVVSDYRLFEPEIKDIPNPKMQPKQGYDFLIDLSKQNDRYNALIALSGLSKWFLMESFRKEQIDVKVYSKGGLLGGGHKLFVDDIEHLGEIQFEVIKSFPKSDTWAIGQIDKKGTKDETIKSYPMMPIYVYHRKHKDYSVYEEEINKKAEKLARELEFILDKGNPLNFTTMTSVFGEATTTFKNDLDKDYPTFRKRLLFRRVFLYLLAKGFNKNAISSLIQNGKILPLEVKVEKSEEKTKSKQPSKKVKAGFIAESTIKNIIMNCAIAPESDLPYNILLEEKYFLHHYMQLPIYDMSKMLDQSQIIINAILNKIIGKELPAELHNYTSGESNEIVLTSIFELPIFIEKLLRVLESNEQRVIFIEAVNELIQLLQDLIPVFQNAGYLEEIKDRLETTVISVYKKETK